jgi:hypothetical protein
MKIATFAGVIAALLLSASAIASPNLVQNAGFENGNTDWHSSMAVANFGAGYSHSGVNSAETGCVGHVCVSQLGLYSFLGQTLDTVAGESYDLSFWVGEPASGTSELSVFWDGVQIADILNPANNTLPGSMIQFTFNNCSRAPPRRHSRSMAAKILVSCTSMTFL